MLSASSIQVNLFCCERIGDLQHASSALARLSQSFKQSRDKDGCITGIKRSHIFYKPFRRRTSSYVKYKIPRRLKLSKIEKEKLGSCAGSHNTLQESEYRSTTRYRKRRRRMGWLLASRCKDSASFSSDTLVHSQEAARSPSPHTCQPMSANTMKWLPTHAWLCKHMAMRPLWSFMLPIRSYSRIKGMDAMVQCRVGRRPSSAARALPTSCAVQQSKININTVSVLHDASYFRTLHLSGTLQELTSVLTRCIDPSSAHTEKGVAIQVPHILHKGTSGVEESLLFYEPDSFPKGCIGPVMVILVPVHPRAADNSARRLHLSLHPCIVDEVVSCLTNLVSQYESVSLCRHNAGGESIGAGAVQIGRLRIRGVGSLRALKSALNTVPCKCNHTSIVNCTRSCTTPECINNALYSHLVSDVGRRAVHGWKGGHVLAVSCFSDKLNTDAANIDVLSSPKPSSCGPSNPRGKFRLSADSNNLKSGSATPNRRLIWSESAALSPILGASFTFAPMSPALTPFPTHRQCQNAIKGHERANRFSLQSQPTIPETTPQSFPPDSFDVLIIRKSYSMAATSNVGSHYDHFGAPQLSGFDLLLPLPYISTIFLRLVQSGVAPVGIEEMACVQGNCGVPTFPNDFADTRAGMMHWEGIRGRWKTRDVARPPRKRVGEDGWEMVRLACMDDVNGDCEPQENTLQSGIVPDCGIITARSLKQAYIMLTTLPTVGPRPVDCIPVLLGALGRGTPTTGSLIFLPNDADYNAFSQPACTPTISLPMESLPARMCIGSISTGSCIGGRGGNMRLGLGMCSAAGIGSAIRLCNDRQSLLEHSGSSSRVIRFGVNGVGGVPVLFRTPKGRVLRRGYVKIIPK